MALRFTYFKPKPISPKGGSYGEPDHARHNFNRADHATGLLRPTGAADLRHPHGSVHVQDGADVKAEKSNEWPMTAVHHSRRHRQATWQGL